MIKSQSTQKALHEHDKYYFDKQIKEIALRTSSMNFWRKPKIIWIESIPCIMRSILSMSLFV